MSLAEIVGVPSATPIVELGVGDSYTPSGVGRWQVSRWGQGTWFGQEPWWWDVTCHVHDIDSYIGHDRTTDAWEVGTAVIVLSNETGWADFPPTVPDQSPVLTVRPGRRIRVCMALDDGEPVTLWFGYVDRADPGYDPELGDIVTLDCICAKGEAGRVDVEEIDPAVGANELVAARLTRVLDTAGWASNRRIIQASGVALLETTLGARCVDLLDLAADSAGGAVFGNNNGHVEYRNRDWQMYSPAKPVDATISNSPAAAVPESDGYLVGTVGFAATAADLAQPLPDNFVIAAKVRGPAVDATLIGQWPDPAFWPQAAWKILRGTNGAIALSWSADGANLTAANVLAGPVPTGGDEHLAVAVSLGTPSQRGWITFPGTVSNYLTVPDAPALDLNGDLSMVVRMRPVTWTPAADDGLVGKFAAWGQYSYYLALLTTGQLRWVWSADGMNVLFADSEDNLADRPVGWLYVAVTFQPNNGLSGRNIRFFTSPDGNSWDPLGDTVTQPGVTSVFNSTSPLEIASLVSGAAANFEGDIDVVSISNGFVEFFGFPGGDEVFRYDALTDLVSINPAATSFTAASGHTVTVNRSSTPDTTITPTEPPSGTRDVTLYTSDDGETWTPYVSDLGQAAIDRHRSQMPVVVGAANWNDVGAVTEQWDGRIYWVEMREASIPGEGEVRFRFDANDRPFGQSSWTDPRDDPWIVSSPSAIVDYIPPVIPVCPSGWELSFARDDIATRVLIARHTDTNPLMFADPEGRALYGVETYERTDLETVNTAHLTSLGNRHLNVRSHTTMPRIVAVTLDAATDPYISVLLAKLADPRKGPRYRCHHQSGERIVFDREMFVVAARHRISPDGWSARLTLDVAEPYVTTAGRWGTTGRWQRSLWGSVA